MVVPCACGDKNCKIQIRFEKPNILWLTQKDGVDTLMYLDYLSAYDLVESSKKMLDSVIDSMMIPNETEIL